MGKLKYGPNEIKSGSSTITEAELANLGGTTSTSAELDYLAGLTIGVQAASKAVVPDANVNTGISKITALHIGATGSETEVTSTAAELNILDTVTATAGELNILDDTADNVTIVYSTGVGTDNIVVTITVVDAAAVAIDAVHKLEVFITDDDIGGVLTSTAASGNLTATTGAVLTALTAKKHVTASTAATGILVLDLVDSANTAGERFCVINPVSGKVIVGDETVATDYEGGV